MSGEVAIMRVKDLKINQREPFTMLLKSVSEVKGSNGPFCVLKLRPSKNEAEVEAKLWKTTREDVLLHVSEMHIVSLFITAAEWGGKVSYIADSLQPAAGEGGIDAFIDCSQIPGSEMHGYVTKVLAKYNSPASAVAGEMYRNYKDSLCLWPAAMSVHHAYKGGLMQHMGTVTSDCKRFCCCAFGEHINTVNTLDASGCIRYVITYVKQHAANTDAGRVTVRILQEAMGSSMDPRLARKKLLSVMLAVKLSGNYPFLNVPLLISAAALRGFSRLMADPMVSITGAPASDMLMLKKNATDEELGKEEIKLLLHCLLVDKMGGQKAAIPEAYLASELDGLEELLEEAGTANAAGTFDEASLLAAAAVHDIGKLQELSSDDYGKAAFELDGNLYGHTAIALRMTSETADRMNIPQETLHKMLHCIASHHGKAEWGAMVEPADIEAKILSSFDFIDSRLEMYRYAAEQVEAGERNEATRKYLGNIVYRPVNN